MNGLLRHLNPKKGPVLSVRSSAHPNRLSPLFWFSMAEVSVPSQEGQPLVGAGAGWSNDKATSQWKSIVEAMERFAYWQCRERKIDAGLEWDPTSTGFAAAPYYFDKDFAKLNALHEAIERWNLNLLNDDSQFSLNRLAPKGVVRKLFKKNSGRWKLYYRTQHVPSVLGLESHEVYFVLSIIERPNGGIIPGSACGKNLNEAIERAAIETYNHVRKVSRIEKGLEQVDPKLTVQRLWNFSHDIASSHAVSQKIERAQRNPNKPYDIPQIAFAGEIHGQWNPEVTIFRVVLENSLPLHLGGLDRFMV